jgi:hypothetical protein
VSFRLGSRTLRSHLGQAAIAAAGALLALPAGAGAATVVNGDFEAGNLSGWVTRNEIADFPFPGSWFAYSGTEAPISTESEEVGEEEFEEFPRSVLAPPQGTFAAISDQNGPGTHILYQDIYLEPRRTHTLSMLVYYVSEEPIVAPDTLSAGIPGVPNQQYRVDVMKPGAPILSVNPVDILTTLYRTPSGAPQVVTPTAVSADLTPFAGQTVRIRLAEADNELFFNAGADAISVASVAPPPSNAFTFGKLQLNKKKGTGKLAVNVPDPGRLTAVDVRSLGTARSALPSKRPPVLIKKAQLGIAAAGTAKLNLKPTGVGKKTLKKTGKLSFKLLVTFTPTGGTAAGQTFKGKLKLQLTRRTR